MQEGIELAQGLIDIKIIECNSFYLTPPHNVLRAIVWIIGKESDHWFGL